MDRKRRIYGRLLTLVSISAASAMCLCNCTAEKQERERTEISVHFGNSHVLTKADAPDEDLIKDISLIIFNPHGEAEE